MSERSGEKRGNRLAQETSPYLLQHAENPVDWYAWGSEALTRAQQEGRPILLSIGYSACHWCHVMERESFCNEETARLMNEHFVCIKVDREERPDLDEIYMAATIAMTGSGGWPMTVFLTPDQEPFFAGTYFPPQDVPGRPGFPNLLERIAELWTSERGKLVQQAAQLTASVRERARAAAPMAVGRDAIEQAVGKLRDSFDENLGGFGPAPKFPQPVTLDLLLRHHRRSGDARSLEMVTVTLDGMARGGMRDHLGGGFARYSTDARWLVPHFEKMLYDNASLARVYAEAYQVSGDEDYGRVAVEAIGWVLREMTAPGGGFYSATDADSEGEEGKFFVWTPAEVAAALSADEAEAFCVYYDVRQGGNWEGKSILHTPRSLADVARQLDCPAPELEQRLASARGTLLALRAERVPPLLDDKILTSWNGLMIGALAECGRILDEPTYVAAAARAADFVWETLRRPDGRLWRTFRDGRAHLEAVLEDYAYLGDGLLDLYEAGGGQRFLRRAVELCDRLVADFSDEQNGGFFATGKEHEQLLVRFREGQDGALPSPNGVAARALARLAALRDDPQQRRHAEEAVSTHGRLIERAPAAFTGSLRVVDWLLEGPTEIVLVGAPTESGTVALRRELGRHYLPNRIIVHHDPAEPDDLVAEPLRRGRDLVDGKSAAYVCRNFACHAPVTDPAELGEALGRAEDAAQAKQSDSLRREGLAGAATVEGTTKRAKRAAEALRDTGFTVLGRTGWRASRLGFGGYRVDERAPGHDEALRRALRGGCNLIDTSTNYTDGDSERLIGRVLRELTDAEELARDEVIVVSKVGYVQGANLDHARARSERGEPFEEMVRYSDDCWHCIHPSFLADQLTRSLDRLGLETLDVCLLHNPEYFLSDAKKRGGTDLPALREQFYRRIEAAFAYLESQVQAGRIRHYGVSSNSLAAPTEDFEATDPSRFWAAATSQGGADHHFSVLQLPVNLLEARSALDASVARGGDGSPSTVLQYARDKQLAVLANRPLNAFGSRGLTRLAEPLPTESPSVRGFAEELEDLGELEQRFGTLFGSRLRLGAGRPVGALLDWSAQLSSVDGKLESTDQVAQIAYGQVLPRTTRVLVAVEASLEGSTAELFAAWQRDYLAALERCFHALRAQVHQRMADRAFALNAELAPHIAAERRDQSLQRKALWVLTSTPGLDVVLLGMRQPVYVEDALAVMSWTPDAAAAASYEAFRAPR